MSDDETPDMPTEEQVIPDADPESVTKPKKKGNWEFTPARKAALEKAHAARAEKAAQKKKLKKETEAKALEIIEDRRLQTTAEDDKLDHVLYELEKIKKHVKNQTKDIPENLKPPPPARRSRKKEPEPDTESEITDSDYATTETESTRPPPPRKKNPKPADRPKGGITQSQIAEPEAPKYNILFG